MRLSHSLRSAIDAWLSRALRLGASAFHDSSQAGKRPALVLSELPFQKTTERLLVCPITNRVRGHGFEVPLSKNMKTQGVVLCQQVRTLDAEERLGQFIEKAPKAVVERALHIVRILVS